MIYSEFSEEPSDLLTLKRGALKGHMLAFVHCYPHLTTPSPHTDVHSVGIPRSTQFDYILL